MPVCISAVPTLHPLPRIPVALPAGEPRSVSRNLPTIVPRRTLHDAERGEVEGAHHHAGLRLNARFEPGWKPIADRHDLHGRAARAPDTLQRLIACFVSLCLITAWVSLEVHHRAVRIMPLRGCGMVA